MRSGNAELAASAANFHQDANENNESQHGQTDGASSGFAFGNLSDRLSGIDDESSSLNLCSHSGGGDGSDQRGAVLTNLVENASWVLLLFSKLPELDEDEDQDEEADKRASELRLLFSG